MSEVISLPIKPLDWRFDDFEYFRKCGEITVSPDKQCFGLNCVFCPGICLRFEVFMQHVREHHGDNVDELYIASSPKVEQATQTGRDAEVADSGSGALGAGAGAFEEFDWHETSLVTGLKVERLEPEPEALQEEVGTEYIFEEHLAQSEVEEEETVDPFDGYDYAAGSAVEKNAKNHINRNYEQYHVMPPKTTKTKAAATAKPKPKEKKPKIPAMREVEHNKEVVNYLLEAYKNNQKLWNPQHPHYKYNASRKIFDELSAPLLEDMNCTLSGSEIFAIINGLRSRYRRELTKLKDSKGKYKPKIWYFDKLEFLRDIIESKRAERAARDSVESTEDERLHPTIDDPSQFIQTKEVLAYVLECFRREESLWNSQHADYLYCDKDELFEKISMRLQEDLNVYMSGKECCGEVQKLLTRYRKELRIYNKCKGLYVPKLWCFEKMKFLQSNIENEVLKRSPKKIVTKDSKPRTRFLKSKRFNFENHEDHLKFVALYRNYPTLWDVTHPDYRSATYRGIAMKEMLEEFNVIYNSKSTLEELQNSLYYMRKDFSAEKHKRLLNGGTSSEPSKSLIYTALAEFLYENLGPFLCEVCDTVIKTSDQYKLHKSVHDGTLPFTCTLCGKGFQMPGNLTIHIRRHKRDFPYACNMCDKSFATSTEVAIHLRSHTNERPYVCDLCGKSFKTWSLLYIHRRIHLKDSNFHCPICNKDFYEKHRFTNHMNGHLNIRKHKCGVCSKSFTTHASLMRHNELHLPVKKYKCTQCSKRFAQFASLRWHRQKTHKQILPKRNSNEL